MLDKLSSLWGFKGSNACKSLELLPRDFGGIELSGDAEHLFKSNVVVYRCISLIAKSIASIEWYLQDENGPVSQHAFKSLLDSPNPLQSKESFLESLVTNLLLFGNAYVYRTGEAFHSWKILKSTKVRLDSDSSGKPKQYIYSNDLRDVKIPINQETGESDILNIRSFNTDSEYYGMSPCSVIAKVVEFYNQVTEHNISLLKKGGRPSGVLRVNSDRLNKEEFARLEETVRRWNTGATNAGEIMVMSSDCQWHEMGLRPLDTNFLEGQHAAARQVAQVFGVPPMLIGIQGDATFANYREARVHFWEDTVLPIMQKICGEMNLWFFNALGLKLVPNVNDIEALEPKRNDTWKHVDQASFLTINEKRAYFGYPPLDKEELGQCAVDNGRENSSEVREVEHG